MLCDDNNEHNIVESLIFPTIQRYGTHARGPASQYGFVEATEPGDALWLLVNHCTSSSTHPLTLPQIPSTLPPRISHSLRPQRLPQALLYSMTTNPNS